jgi:fructose-1,6-bisphosphatase I
MYEAAPLAAVAEAAGGAASNGHRRILDLVPETNHQRTPIFIGSKADVGRLDDMVAEPKAFSIARI